MAKATNRLTAKAVQSTRHNGATDKHLLIPDGGGLYLQVTKAQGKSWLLRFTLKGKTRAMGLGALEGVSLADARQAAEEARKLVRAGTDPIAHRDGAVAFLMAAKAATAAEAQRQASRTFKAVAEAYIAAHGRAWSPVHAAQWPSTLATYVYPVMGHLPVNDVTRDHVLTVLRPIWQAKAETANRVRGRIEKVLDYGAVDDPSLPANPARAPVITLKLGKQAVQVRHHPALPWRLAPGFMKALQARERSPSALALEFAILTAARLSEVRLATWREVDLETGTWIVPAARMKMRQEHRVPLSDRAKAILTELKPLTLSDDSLLFPGHKPKAALSIMALDMLLRRFKPTWKDRHGEAITVHGFRSTFRDWCAEATDTPRELAETALAHRIGGVEGAYQRGDMFMKRRKLMDEWGAYLASGKPIVVDVDASWQRVETEAKLKLAT